MTGHGLLEREQPLTRLCELLDEARSGRGHVAVILGDAGLGKTALLAALAEAAGPALRWLQAGCDPLHTPRPLGPLVDLSDQLPAELRAALHAGRTYNGLFPALQAWLGGAAAPAVLAIEDLHWADDATLDGVRYLGRRIAASGLLLILTLRPDPADAAPALRQTLAALDAAACVHIELQPLSAAAVHELAVRAGRPAGDLHAQTGGNPFFVQQLLRAEPGRLPGSLRDAVLAQADALDAPARQALDLLCLSPGGLELDLLLALQPTAPEALAAPAARPLVRVHPPWVSVRHELARQVLDEALAPTRRWQLHQALLQALADRPARPGLLARRVHHAAGAGLSAAVCALAPQAAQEAEAVGAHRSAVQLLRLALEHGDDATVLERAAWYDRLALSCHALHRVDEAVAARRASMDLREQAGDHVGHACSQAQLALQLTPDPGAEPLARQAVRTLAGHPPGPPRALAESALAIALANVGRAGEAVEHARAAMQAAEQAGDADMRLHATTIAASVELSLAPSEPAFARLAACIDEGMAQGRPQRVVVPLVNLCSVALVHADYARVVQTADRGIAYAAARDLDMALAHLHVRRALALLEMARWDDAEASLDALQRMSPAPQRQLGSAQVLRARVQALRGLRNEAGEWDERVAAARSGSTDLLPTYVVTAAAEAAWLRGDTDAAARWAAAGLAEAEGPWVVGHLRAWVRRCGGALGPAATPLSAPHALAEGGRWRDAADAWLQRGCPVSAAWALLEGDAEARREALQRLQGAAADGVARRVRQVLQAGGLRGLERGPYGHVRTDPLGLTRRERQVAELVAQGLSNAAIGERLRRSERTVSHHVSAVLGKLGVDRRAQVAGRLGAEPAPVDDARGAQDRRRRRANQPSAAQPASASDDGSGTVPG